MLQTHGKDQQSTTPADDFNPSNWKIEFYSP